MFPYEPINDFNEREKMLDKLKDSWKEYDNYILETKGQFYIDNFNKDIDDFRNKKVPEVYLIQPKGTLVHLINSKIKYNRNTIKRSFDTKHTNKYKRRYKRR